MPPVSYAEASGHIQRYADSLLANAPSSESLPLHAALGRILAKPIYADRDLPPWPRSTRDGFACRAVEASTHQPLLVTGQIRAGQTPSGVISPGHAWEIMTGAPVPQGADAVVMLEHAEVLKNSDAIDGTIRLSAQRSIAPGENIVPQAAEARSGDLLLATGTRIAAAQIALAAQCGYSGVAVYRPPRVAILATGDELVSIESTPGPSQIRNSNSPMLAALVAAGGGEPFVFTAVPDQEPALNAALQQAIESAPDLLLITGGISAGRFDLVEDALVRLGARFLFQGVSMQPGKPVVFAEILRAARTPFPVLALPGNPISSAVTFHLFAAPLLAALAGSSSPGPRFAQATLAAAWRGHPGLTRFLPALCDFAPEPQVRQLPWQGSGDLAAFARANCLLVVPADARELQVRSTVGILLI